MRRLVEVERSRRNREGGYWIAEADPEAARRGLVRRWRRQDVDTVAVATDGVTAAVDRYDLHPGWMEALLRIDEVGADGFLASIEAAERSDPEAVRWPRSKVGDDKTLMLVRLGPPTGVRERDANGPHVTGTGSA